MSLGGISFICALLHSFWSLSPSHCFTSFQDLLWYPWHMFFLKAWTAGIERTSISQVQFFKAHHTTQHQNGSEKGKKKPYFSGQFHNLNRKGAGKLVFILRFFLIHRQETHFCYCLKETQLLLVWINPCRERCCFPVDENSSSRTPGNGRREDYICDAYLHHKRKFRTECQNTLWDCKINPVYESQIYMGNFEYFIGLIITSDICKWKLR